MKDSNDARPDGIVPERPEVVEDTPAEVVHVTGVEPPEAMMWRHFRKIGLSLAGSGFVPQPYQNKPDEIMACLAYGHELGLGPMQSLQSIDVIQGKPTLKPETMRALIRAQGHTLMRLEATAERVVLFGKRRDNGDEETVTYTIEDAHSLGLTGKDNWKKQPRAMLTARATSEIGRSLFSDVIMGASYTPEELGGDNLPDDEPSTDHEKALYYGVTGDLRGADEEAEVVEPKVWAADDPARPFEHVPLAPARPVVETAAP